MTKQVTITTMNMQNNNNIGISNCKASFMSNYITKTAIVALLIEKIKGWNDWIIHI